MSYIGNTPGVSSQRLEDTFTATAGQTTFTASNGYVPGNIDVYLNGVKLINGLEFTASNGINVVLGSACAEGDSVVLLSYIPRGLSDGYLKSESDAKFLTALNPNYTGTLTGGTGVINIGSGQLYKDASGNVGIGTGAPIAGLHVATSTRSLSLCPPSTGLGGASYILLGNSDSAGAAGPAIIASSNRAIQFGIGDSFSSATGGSFSELARIDSSGNLIVGGTAATNTAANRGNITLNGASTAIISVGTGGTERGYIYTQGTDFLVNSSTGNLSLQTSGANVIQFQTSGSERMRIDSSGRLLINSTGPIQGDAMLNVSSGLGMSVVAATNITATTGLRIHWAFYQNGQYRGEINSGNNTGVQYISASDYRLKESVQPMTGALEKVAALKPVTYRWKSDGSYGDGFIAHELQEVCPEAVSGHKDAVDAEGKPVYQGVDTSFLVATLTAAIQEQQQMINELRNEIAAIKGA